jgi:hypothetical protein
MRPVLVLAPALCFPVTATAALRLQWLSSGCHSSRRTFRPSGSEHCAHRIAVSRIGPRVSSA